MSPSLAREPPPAEDDGAALRTRFRDAMMRHAAAVCVVTAQAGGEVRGFTATAVCSLTADPPRVAVFANRSAETLGLLTRAGAFAVNCLGEDYALTAATFADPARRDDRFERGAWEGAGPNAPILKDAVYALRCRLEQTSSIGTHVLLVGAVEEVRLGCGANPLLYHERTFRRLAPTLAQG